MTKKTFSLQALDYKKEPIPQIRDITINVEGKRYRGLSNILFVQTDGSMKADDYIRLASKIKETTKKQIVILPSNIKFFKLKMSPNNEKAN